MASRVRIFISHSHEDNAWCREFVAALRAQNTDVWYDEHNMGYGALSEEIERELRTRSIFIVVLSPHSINSRWVAREVDAAIHLQDRDSNYVILPVMAATCEVPLLWVTYKRVSGPNDTGLPPTEAARRTAHALGIQVHETPASPLPLPVTVPPKTQPEQLPMPMHKPPLPVQPNTTNRGGWQPKIVGGVISSLVFISLVVALVWNKSGGLTPSQSIATQTANAAAAMTATATATPKLHLPYSASAPGPGCDKGSILWQKDDQMNLTCYADHTHVAYGGTIWWGDFIDQLPENFTISFKAGDFGHITDPYTAIVRLGIFANISGTTPYVEYTVEGDSDNTEYFFSCASGINCTDTNKTAYPISSSMHTWTIRFDSASVSASVDGHLIGSLSDVTSRSVYRVAISIGAGATADIADWKITSP